VQQRQAGMQAGREGYMLGRGASIAMVLDALSIDPR
jgi:hypothetical protein